jgi:hypothetical protein
MTYATPGDAHREWHLNSGIPMGTPGCPQDACHPVYDDYDEPEKQYTVDDCTAEFGEHNHDPDECYSILARMEGDDFDFTSYDYPGYDAQTDHYERFGRPAFPNEY